MSEVDIAVRAIRAGELAVLPTDTVYGLVCTAFDEQAAADLYRLKGRDSIQPTALLAASVEALLELVPELGAGPAAAARVLFPGPFTLVVPNPSGRFPWLCRSRPGTIGLRVPLLSSVTAEIVGRLGAVVATSANLPGGTDPRRLAEVPEEILAGVAVAIDGGELPGVPSTVVDVTATEPVILRAGAGDPADAVARIASVHT